MNYLYLYDYSELLSVVLVLLVLFEARQMTTSFETNWPPCSSCVAKILLRL